MKGTVGFSEFGKSFGDAIVNGIEVVEGYSPVRGNLRNLQAFDIPKYGAVLGLGLLALNRKKEATQDLQREDYIKAGLTAGSGISLGVAAYRLHKNQLGTATRKFFDGDNYKDAVDGIDQALSFFKEESAPGVTNGKLILSRIFDIAKSSKIGKYIL